MRRTQIYIDPKHFDYLETFAFLMTRQENKRITVSQIVRLAIEDFHVKHPVPDETDIIINSPLLMKSLQIARKQTKLLTHEEVFGTKLTRSRKGKGK